MAEANLIKVEDLARAREIEFAYNFKYQVDKLVEALSVTRKIAKVEGAALKAYKATGVLEDGAVPEGDLIPLSHYKVEEVPIAPITLMKWRKSTSAEAILERGYDQAVEMTNDKALEDIQKTIKTNFFNFLGTGTTATNGTGFQDTLAQVWGQLHVLFEDNDIKAVFFVNPLDIAGYLGTAQIITQTAFGMSYVKDFMGLGTVFMNAAVPKGKVYGTAASNIVLYYIAVNAGDFGTVFNMTTDELGLIGIHENAVHNNLTCETQIATGVTLFAERLDGIVVGTVNP